MSDHKEVYKSLPAVDKLLASPELLPMISSHGKELVTYAIRQTLNFFRHQINIQPHPPEWKEIIEKITLIIRLHSGRHLKKVYNASGVIIHTNLGRAPFSPEMLKDSFEVLQGYNNLEFDLKTGSRGSRNDHASGILKFLTGAEDILVVNNAAAAVMMILRAFAKNKEVIISRGELIEIGGSFRIPDIMAVSDCKMMEVGTTNKTRLSDYENAINGQTALLFKAHKSNFIISGFTEEVSLGELVKLGRKFNIPVIFDLGSGLLRKISHPVMAGEPDVKEALATGVDLVCFSGDKLLGGPQAGIIAGRRQLIETLKKEAMMRALRVCKTTLALLETACCYYLSEDELKTKNLIFKAFHREKQEILKAAERLQSILSHHGITAQVVPSEGQCGGGSLPDAGIESYAVLIRYGKSNKTSSAYAEKMYRQLLSNDKPVLGILKQGNILFDMLTIDNEDIAVIGQVITESNDLVLKH